MAYYSGPRQARRFTEFRGAQYPASIKRYAQSKLNDRAVAAELGLRVPRQFALFPGPAQIDLAQMPDRFVLKTNGMFARLGVYLLERRGDRFFDFFTATAFTEQQLRDDLTARLTRRGYALDMPIIAEEFVVGENGAGQIPYDYKLYTIDGVVHFIAQVDRNTTPTGIAFFGEDFEPLDGHHIEALNPALQRRAPALPANAGQLLDVARRISLHLDVPLLSVDLYTTGDDVVVGEITSSPGVPYFGLWRFSDVFDGELGAHFRAAYKRRGAPIPTVEGLPPVLHQAQLEADRRARKAASLRATAAAFAAAIRIKIASLFRSRSGWRPVTHATFRPSLIDGTLAQPGALLMRRKDRTTGKWIYRAPTAAEITAQTERRGASASENRRGALVAGEGLEPPTPGL